MVTQSRFVEPANLTATSRLRQIRTLPKTLSSAGRTFSSWRILLSIGNTSCESGYSRLRARRRLSGRNVTRPALSLFRYSMILDATASSSTTTWNSWFAAAASTAAKKRSSHSISSIKGPCTPLIPWSFTMRCTAESPRNNSRGMVNSSCLSRRFTSSVFELSSASTSASRRCSSLRSSCAAFLAAIFALYSSSESPSVASSSKSLPLIARSSRASFSADFFKSRTSPSRMPISSRLRASVASQSAACSSSHASRSALVLNCEPRPCLWCSTCSRLETSPISAAALSSRAASASALGRAAEILARVSATARSSRVCSPRTPASASSPEAIFSANSCASRSHAVFFSTARRSSMSADSSSSLVVASARSLSLHSRSIAFTSSRSRCARSSSSRALSTCCLRRSSHSSSLARVSLRSFSCTVYSSERRVRSSSVYICSSSFSSSSSARRDSMKSTVSWIWSRRDLVSSMIFKDSRLLSSYTLVPPISFRRSRRSSSCMVAIFMISPCFTQ
mmetsp:Transcript_15303/g.64570  ORF Transcript_15303/g.64570 Transcript_15303/m.64570 type:complete len:508 (-) Transcript_15303:592-2115(-)